MKNKGYVCVMAKHHCFGWYWFIDMPRGHRVIEPRYYKTKAQCRNVGKKFADSLGIEWREE